MRSVPEIVPVTLVQEVLTPSREIARLIGEFTKEPIDPQTILLRSSARRAILRTQGEAHPNVRYAEKFRIAERRLARLGARALMLGSSDQPSELLVHPSGRTRLTVHPRRQEELDAIINALEVLPSLDQPEGLQNYLYMQFAAGALHQDVGRRTEMLEKFNARLRHPAFRPALTATQPRLTLQDTVVRHDRPAV